MIPSIRLFLHRLDDALAGDESKHAGVTPAELARSLRFHFAEDRRRWLGGRAWIRRTLGSALDRPPASLAFSLGPHGKPRLLEAPPGFDCNWSHSGDRIALAISDSAPVGVDLEVLRDDFPSLDVARQFFTPAETSALELSEGSARQKLFLRLWTAKEALMKATGAGVSLPPDKIGVSLSNAMPTGYSSHPEWQIAPSEAHQWAAAVAWPSRLKLSVETIET